LSYEGVLVYAHDSRLETLRIVHTVENGKVKEVLESLNGPSRRVTRDNDRVTCRLSGDGLISVHGQGLSMDLLGSGAINPRSLSPNYTVRSLGSARVAGRQTEVVGIIPRDALRYGYRFYLDLESGLPLKSDLIGTEDEPIEQIIFTSLTLGPNQVSAVVRKHESLVETDRESPANPPRFWRFEHLPEGFELIMVDHSADDAERGLEHFVLSDGLASVSVYIEKGAEDGLSGGSRIGAVHAVGGKVAGHQVTVVGEVPADTVDAVLAGVVRVGGSGM
jgi:sigma-E factor negative regulatory protein RseB